MEMGEIISQVKKITAKIGLVSPDQDATSSKLFLNFLPNKEWYPTWVSGSMNAGLDY